MRRRSLEATIRKGETSPSLTEEFDISLAAVSRTFDAWLNADRLGRFPCAGDTHVASVEVDAQVAVRSVVMADDRGRYEHRGRYLDISRPERLRFTWTSAATRGAETIVTVTFDIVEDGTRLTLVHVGLLVKFADHRGISACFDQEFLRSTGERTRYDTSLMR